MRQILGPYCRDEMERKCAIDTFNQKNQTHLKINTYQKEWAELATGHERLMTTGGRAE